MHYRAHDSVRLVPGVGPKTVEHLERMGIRSVFDLLHWFPRRYIDASNPLPLNLVQFGFPVAIRVTVDSLVKKRTKRGLSFVDAEVSDDSGVPLTLRFFNQPYVDKKLTIGSTWTCVGAIERFHGQNILPSPVLLDEPQVIPVYPQTKGVTSWMLQKFIRQVINDAEIEDIVPDSLREREELPPYRDMLRLIHQPVSMADEEQGRKAMAFIEAFSFFMNVAQSQQLQVRMAGSIIDVPVEWLKNVVESLPFELTAGQKRVVWDSLTDMKSGKLMTRLLNGDVGSGKTVVAALLAACVAQTGKKSIILAPTEILAQQHAKTVAELLKTAGCRVALWTAATKEDADSADIIVGTHAVIHDNFAVKNVGLVVVDEQHRFGVKQRAALRDKQEHPPHVLAMTATPIPRTLALVLFADLQVSFLKEKPKNRQVIHTDIIPINRRREMEGRIAQEVAAGRQVFVLCPLIEKEEVFTEGEPVVDPKEIKTVSKEAERLRKEHPEFGRVAELHGRMKAKEKEALMAEVKAGKVDVLVATSVIEVGVDLPNATVMVIENAERFGLAQLHQLRGRVGRGKEQSYCFLCPTIGGGPAIERLKALVEYESGFDIAERDLELRGPGDLTGIVQSGLPDFKMARLTDLEFLQRVKGVVQTYVEEHPEFPVQWQERGLSSAVAGLE
ncbi:MAG TPA: ATP-dependent DNA helicase RecG [Verrucomicrobiae bacterium]|nr:ATP-dependent DNA helicase RecG [Verrucomicrobiae bacterium]